MLCIGGWIRCVSIVLPSWCRAVVLWPPYPSTMRPRSGDVRESCSRTNAASCGSHNRPDIVTYHCFGEPRPGRLWMTAPVAYGDRSTIVSSSSTYLESVQSRLSFVDSTSGRPLLSVDTKRRGEGA